MERGHFAGRCGNVLLSARRDFERCLVGQFSADAQAVAGVRGHLSAFAGRISAARFRDRHPHRCDRLARRRRRIAPHQDHEPFANSADHRADKLRRGGHGRRGRRRDPPGVQQTICANGNRPRATRNSLHAPTPVGTRASRLDAASDVGAWPVGGRNLLRNGPREIPGSGTRQRQSAGHAPSRSAFERRGVRPRSNCGHSLHDLAGSR